LRQIQTIGVRSGSSSPNTGIHLGPDTVSTIPPATMDAFRDHGRLRPSLEEDVAGAQAVMNALPLTGPP